MSTSASACLQRLRQQLVGAAGLGDAGRVVVREDHRRGVARERRLDDLARVDARLRERAAEELLARDQPVLAVEEERRRTPRAAARPSSQPQVVAHRLAATSARRPRRRPRRAARRPISDRRRELRGLAPGRRLGPRQRRGRRRRTARRAPPQPLEHVARDVERAAPGDAGAEQDGDAARRRTAPPAPRREQPLARPLGFARSADSHRRSLHAAQCELRRSGPSIDRMDDAVATTPPATRPAPLPPPAPQRARQSRRSPTSAGLPAGGAPRSPASSSASPAASPRTRPPSSTRLFVKAGVDVDVVMTDAATRFVAPMTLPGAVRPAGADRPVGHAAADNGMGHIDLSRGADLDRRRAGVRRLPGAGSRRAAPTTCSSTLCLARDCPLVVAPAMNRQMWSNAATQRNVAQLAADGVAVLGPGSGDQACGEIGEGRMLEPEEIFAAVDRAARSRRSSPASACCVTAGPTFEAIDPVRGITNFELGQDGLRAGAGRRRGRRRRDAGRGPTALADAGRAWRASTCVSAADMARRRDRARRGAATCSSRVAAVADYTPAQRARAQAQEEPARR